MLEATKESRPEKVSIIASTKLAKAGLIVQGIGRVEKAPEHTGRIQTIQARHQTSAEEEARVKLSVSKLEFRAPPFGNAAAEDQMFERI